MLNIILVRDIRNYIQKLLWSCHRIHLRRCCWGAQEKLTTATWWGMWASCFSLGVAWFGWPRLRLALTHDPHDIHMIDTAFCLNWVPKSNVEYVQLVIGWETKSASREGYLKLCLRATILVYTQPSTQNASLNLTFPSALQNCPCVPSFPVTPNKIQCKTYSSLI